MKTFLIQFAAGFIIGFCGVGYGAIVALAI